MDIQALEILSNLAAITTKQGSGDAEVVSGDFSRLLNEINTMQSVSDMQEEICKKFNVTLHVVDYACNTTDQTAENFDLAMLDSGKFYGAGNVVISKKSLLRMQTDSRFRQKVYESIEGLGCTSKMTAIYEDIRIDHAKRIAEMDLDGYAVGGLAVGETHEEMYHILDETVPHLPVNKPTYLMGVGTPANILEGVARGVDFFDCVYPSRNGRHGHVYTNQGKLNLFNQKFEKDMRPIEEGCQCPACRTYSRAYIRHLLKAKEMLGMRLCVLHNLYFYNTMMEEIRDALDEGRFHSYKEEKLYGMQQGEH